MKNSHLDMQFPHGADTLEGSTTVPLITHPAENSALNANVENEGNPQRSDMQENMGGGLRQSDTAEPGKTLGDRRAKSEHYEGTR